MNPQVLTVSSKGQITLPVSIRKLLSIDTGDKLVAYTSGDFIVFKTLKVPSAEAFEPFLAQAKESAPSVGDEESDENDVVNSTTKRKQE